MLSIYSSSYQDPVLSRLGCLPPLSGKGECKFWSLNLSGIFSIKSFYMFLSDGGQKCRVIPHVWKCACLQKINQYSCDQPWRIKFSPQKTQHLEDVINFQPLLVSSAMQPLNQWITFSGGVHLLLTCKILIVTYSRCRLPLVH